MKGVSTSNKVSSHFVRLVGIGASAGGLEALRDLMGSLPESDSLSYVIAQHVSPSHISMLINLLAPLTPLQVKNLKKKQKPEPGFIYITPPNHDVILDKGQLMLTKPQHAIGPKPSINRFFFSLADELKAHAIGIILSGTGTDGASGVSAIKASGGISIIQDPDTAKYDGMPKAAIDTGNIDLILSCSEIGSALTRLMNHNEEFYEKSMADQKPDDYSQIYSLVKKYTAFKLDAYKENTVKRRIARRMSILGINSLMAYIEYLKNHREESRLLISYMFISVTSFFRDQQSFTTLEKIIEDIVRKQTHHKIIRCWVPGCASGEEVYSIALLLEEALHTQQRSDLQYLIFASDLDEAAIEKARTALYPNSALETIPKHFLETYTENMGGHRRIVKNVRDQIVFARQNVIEDPPFGRLDLISCRNLMIYLNPDAQIRILSAFHYALNPGGFLFLGKSESIDLHKNLFKVVNKKACLYSRQPGSTHYLLPQTQVTTISQPKRKKLNNDIAASTDYISNRALVELTQYYAPPSIIIDETNNILNFYGDLKPYLNFPSGKAGMYLFNMVIPPLRAELRALVYRCRRESKPTEGIARPIEINQKNHRITLIIRPLEEAQESPLLISFLAQAVNQNLTGKPISEKTVERDTLIIKELEKEIANSRAHLNSIIEEHETSNEELQSLNEELHSSNEELQSTNEELQTLNEELQSTNEELLTVNEELHVKTTELEKITTDLVNVKQSLDYPMIVLDRQLHITQANNACKMVIAFENVIEGCSLNSIQWLLEIPGLNSQVRKVIREGARIETILNHPDSNKVFLLHVMPYCTAQNEIAGAILLFNDISAQHIAEAAQRKSEDTFRKAMLYAPIGIAIQSIDNAILEVNPALCKILGYSKDELLQLDIRTVIHPDDLAAHQLQQNQMLNGELDSIAVAKRYLHKNGQIIHVNLNKALVNGGANAPHYFISLIHDITEQKKAEEELRLAASVFTNVLDGIIITDGNAQIIKANTAFEDILGYTAKEVIGKHTSMFKSHVHDKTFYAAMWREINEKGAWHGEIWDRHKDGHLVPIWLSISALKNDNSKADHYIAVMYDMSEQKHFNEKINYLAHYDALTKLPNRTLFTERLKHAIAKAERNKSQFAILFIDLDNFKHINDAHGHPVGDELLCQVAIRLNTIMRSSDTVSRHSGDEFTILIEDLINEDKARLIAEKILTTIAKPFKLLRGRSTFISASIGLALFPNDGETVDTLLKHADLAMYRSKEAGRNHFHFYTQEMSNRMQERMLLYNDLRQALHKNKLQLYYQPIIDISTKTHVGAEALLRWKHPDLGWVPPNKFISIAEDSDLIHVIGEWVLLRACRQMRDWHNADINPGILSINVSGKQLISDNFLTQVQRILKNSGCSPEKIVFEITESFIMQESEGAINTLNKLRELGFGIAIDDFGTGYSSLSYLKRLPVTKLKLDKSFVRDIPDDANDIAIARAILGLGNILGLEVIAEGVETKKQHDFLASEHCIMGQGYHYARPMTPGKFKQYLMNQ
ncbi:MAG: EAL domain-containing protein [Burkholderiales bacterium]|nr:EAL domain-containing protein [Nitrosomonas sp.]MCP5273974.1 EAL domain-containing protein [Burkholderiales bacterium]